MTSYRVLLVPEGVTTSDRRHIQAGALTWRDPAPLMFTATTSTGHDGAEFVGNLTNLRREQVDGVTWIVADLTFDTSDAAFEAQRLVDEAKMPGVSADIGNVTATLEVLETDDDGMPTDWLETVTAGEIIGGTQVAMPAFADAQITLAPAMALVAAVNPAADPSWFTDPRLEGPTPWTVDENGRVYGHLALWGTCHIGTQGACITPPLSPSEYSYFATGAVHLADSVIPVGHVTVGTGHPDLTLTAQGAAAHYDHTGTVAADVAAGEDEYGIWVAGAARPGVDLDVVRAAALSGDWRRINGDLELVAALCVNVPGFPVPRAKALAASGEALALVASGIPSPREPEPDRTVLEQILTELRRPVLTAQAERLVKRFTSAGVPAE